MKANKIMISSTIILLFSVLNLFSQSVPIDTVNFQLDRGEIVEFQERKCLKGSAQWKTSFKNGIIEADVWIPDVRSYPGIDFRVRTGQSSEQIYVRPHRVGLYDDALQYSPVFNGVTCWQLYSGEGYTSGLDIELEKWVRIKIEVIDEQARIFVENMKTPVLFVKELAHAPVSGGLIFNGGGGNVYFSNISIQRTNDLDKIEEPGTPSKNNQFPGWQLSSLQSSESFNLNRVTTFYKDFYAGWEDIEADKTGLVNISKYRKNDNDLNCVFARSTFYSDEEETIKVAFGYSDAIKVFLNEELVYSGNYAYRSRGNSFTGAVHSRDTLYLKVQKGVNELFVISSDQFGGWGLRFLSGKPIQPVKSSLNPKIREIWSKKISEFAPESALYDDKADVLYVSHFDNQTYNKSNPEGFISKMSTTGDMLDSLWIGGLNAPTGICKSGDRLYVVDRKELVEISIKKGEIVRKYPFPDGTAFPNDITVDKKGNIYISNSDPSVDAVDIFTLEKGKIVSWMVSDELANTNGIFSADENVFIGSGGGSKLFSIDLETKETSEIASFGSGIIDGVRTLNNGGTIISQWKGLIYYLSSQGDVTLLLDERGKFNTADFEYDKESSTLFVPTFLGKGLRAFKIDWSE